MSYVIGISGPGKGPPNTEIRVDIPGYEGIYAVSNKGECKSLGRVVPCKRHGQQRVSERILKKDLSKDGRFSVRLSHRGKTKKFQVHRLVAQAFLGLDINDKKSVVMHLDDNPKNNHMDNLKVGTQKENIKMCIDQGKHHSQTPEALRNLAIKRERCRKIHQSEYENIINMIDEGITGKDIAKIYSVDETAIHKIRRKLGYKFPYGLSQYPKGLNKKLLDDIAEGNMSVHDAIDMGIGRCVYYTARKKILEYNNKVGVM